jgi:cysteine desulfurase/selenocysteine lyase
LLPQQVLDKVIEIYSRLPPTAAERRQIRDGVRELLAKLLNSSPEELFFTSNTSIANNFAIGSIQWKPGHEVIVTDNDHDSVYFPLLRLKKLHGIVLKLVKGNADGLIDPSDIEKQITKNTRLITINHVSQVHGTIQKAKEVCSIAREHDILTLIDGALSVGRIPVDLKDIGCDFLSICGRKVFGPYGSGTMYIRREVMDSLEPLLIGHFSMKRVGDFDYKYTDPPIRFEGCGCDVIPAIAGYGEGVKLVSEIGMDKIRSYNAKLLEYMVEKLNEFEGIQFFSPIEKARNPGIVSFRLKDTDPQSLKVNLQEKWKVIISKREAPWRLPVTYNRISVHCFNTKKDIDDAIFAIKQSIK